MSVEKGPWNQLKNLAVFLMTTSKKTNNKQQENILIVLLLYVFCNRVEMCVIFYYFILF